MLGNLASTIVAELPILLERTTQQDAENALLQQQCARLKDTIDGIHRRIEGERAQQQKLRIQLLKLRGPPSSRSESVRERKQSSLYHLRKVLIARAHM